MSSRNRTPRYKPDGSKVTGKGTIDGPGVWVTCNMGKEKQCVGELYDLFESLADELWPPKDPWDSDDQLAEAFKQLDVEERVKRELAILKAPKSQKRFHNCRTDTVCLIYIQCSPTVDPVKLVLHHLEEVERTGITRTRHVQRFAPASGTCQASLGEFKILASKIIPTAFVNVSPNPCNYKIEIKIRAHKKIQRQEAIDEVVKCVPPGYGVSLDNPDIVVLLEIFKGVCTLAVVPDYMRFKTFSPLQIIEARKARGLDVVADPESEDSDDGSEVDEG
ncbi:hypothetical protein SISNIDRAFT_485104 [Sistotremastrum niveocremeum HHB9708]|uniref:THUMP domain-containing protein n=1 Tax=Sistotremastrum niveocremeum HHB9708 TaxID=1314777 RepID=A0A164VI66_9AGAM|nr:hypothetical protein SISNIDRAFT_485104 [Sistotremastrum niveocremeum HHB9708]